jgi:sterol desaturase/sphingolipid hydroxylase (fatty acid hydroxylase superfamily)
MDDHIILECVVFFNFLFFLLWVIFYTYQPWFLKGNDFIAPGDNNRDASGAEQSDKYLSDPGRSSVFLVSLITSIIAAFLFYLLLRYWFSRKQIKCKKGAKSMSGCKIVEN